MAIFRGALYPEEEGTPSVHMISVLIKVGGDRQLAPYHSRE